MLKKGLCLLLAVVLVFTLSGCADTLKNLAGSIMLAVLTVLGDDSADQEHVFKFVRENEAELMEAIQRGDFSAFENQGIVKDIRAEKTVVDFSCGGGGIGSGTSYVGFYYTAEHDMAAVWCAPLSADLLKPAANGYQWQQKNGDNRYYTEHICGNFYYYEASF